MSAMALRFASYPVGMGNCALAPDATAELLATAPAAWTLLAAAAVVCVGVAALAHPEANGPTTAIAAHSLTLDRT